MTDLDLSEWLEMCLHFKSVKIYTGPHAEEFIDGVREYEERIRKLEAKLAKAMEHVADYSNDPHLVEWANATIAELKGQK